MDAAGVGAPHLGRELLRAAGLPALALTAGLALSGCADQQAAPVHSAQLSGPTVSLQEALDVTLRPASPTAAETFLSSLPQPLAVHDRKVANPQDPRRVDTVRTLVYRGLTLTVYRVSSTGSRFPLAVEVTDPHYVTRDGLRVGLSARAALAILGQPTAREGSTWVYSVVAPQGSAPYELRLRLEGGRVTDLRWMAYLD